MKIALIILVPLLIIAGVIGGCIINYYNTAINLETQFQAVQKDNQNQYDNMTKKIMQSAQVTSAQADMIRNIIVEHAQARTTSGGSLMKMVTESIPTIPSEVWTNLQNIIISSRDKFALSQTKLIDIKREHDALRQRFPSSIICSGRPTLEAIIVTSTRTQQAFETGTDDDIDLKLK